MTSLNWIVTDHYIIRLLVGLDLVLISNSSV